MNYGNKSAIFCPMNIFSQAEILEKVSTFVRGEKNGVIEIVGPTASGKTGFSVELALWVEKEFGKKCEIISVDSRQVFRGCDISSAKVTEEEMKGIPHHGLNIVEPNEEYTVVDFQKYACKKIEEIQDRGNIAIMCGGTMLWLDAVSENYVFTDEPGEKSTERGAPKWSFLKIGMHWDRDKLYERLNLRSVQMFERGMIEETKEMLKVPNLTRSTLTSFGYQEIAKMLDKEMTKEEALELNQKRNRNYAKRQLTWWRGREDILWIDSKTINQ